MIPAYPLEAIQSKEIINKEDNKIFLKGAVPGARNGIVTVSK